MSAFRPSGGSGGGIDPAALAALVDDNEATNLYAGIVGTVHQRADALAVAISNARVDLLGSMSSAGLPSGYVAEFPADQVPAGWQVVQGAPDSLPTGIGTVSATRTTGSNALHRGHARTLATNRIWSLYSTALAAFDLSLNRFDAQTFSLPASPGTGSKSAVLHDYSDAKALITIGNNGSLGDARAYTFDATAKTFTQVANFQLIGTDGQTRAGQGGTTLRLADGRIFWMPSETWRTTGSQTTHSNLGATNGGFYFLYDPQTNTVTFNRFSNWAAALATGDLGESGSGSAQSYFHLSLPIGQLPDGRLLIQENASGGTHRYFFLDLVANTITQGTGAWAGGLAAPVAHPQGLAVFSVGSTARRYYNAASDALDLTFAAVYSSASVSTSSQGFSNKALAIGNGNYAIPGANGSTEAYALAFDSFVRRGTVKARKVA